MKGTFTGKLATVKKDGSPHTVPIWFVLESRKKNNQEFDILFTTDYTSIKAKNIRRDNRVSLCVDDQTPPFSFVIVYGIAKIHHYNQKELLKMASQIALRYMGKDKAEEYGRRNSTKGEVLVRLRPKKIIAAKEITGWE